MQNTIFKNFYVEIIKSSEMDIDVFIKLFEDGFDENLKNIEGKVKKLKQVYENDPEIDVYDMVSSDYEKIMITPKYFLNICCVILYSDLEKKLKGILENIFEFDAKRCYVFDEMKKAFNNNDIDLTNLNGYDHINELKELNNCIKHKGYVSKELEKINNQKYKAGEEIKISKETIVNYSNTIHNFLNNLYKKIKELL